MATKRQKKLNQLDEVKRKIKESEDAALALQKEFEAIVALQEKERDDAKKYIIELCKDRSLFCGIILTEEDLLNLLKVKFANPKENIKINFNLYIEEKDE